MDNLLLAFWKAQRGKSRKTDVCEFRKNLLDNIEFMRQELIEKNVSLGDYHYFTIHDPKKRVICAASFRERVLHHAIINVCGDYFERYQIYDSYACRLGKGQTAAIPRAQLFSRRFPWFVKFDIHKYFDTIDHSIVKQLLRRLFKDCDVLRLLDRIIDTYSVTDGKGIPIGNLTSQYFANMYLGKADHFIKRDLKCGGFVRYMDDFICFAQSKEEANRLKKRVEEFLYEQLKLELNPVIINKTQHGFPFLGFRVLPNSLRLLKNTKRRFLDKIKQADARQMQSLLAFVNRAETFSLRMRLFYSGCSSRRHEPG